MKLLDLLKEESKRKYEYGCVMLYFRFPQLFKLQDAIDPKDVYEEKEDTSYGFEDEPHVTLLFGLHEEVTLEDIREVLRKFTFDTCTASNVSIFKNEKYDVLKLDVEGKNLKEANKALKKFPYTNDYPEYHPHMTIAYLQPGTGKKYVDTFKGYKYDLQPSYAIFSQPSGEKTKINIDIE